MKKNRITFIIVIVLAAVALLLVFTNTKSTLRRELKDFALEDTANITKIFLADMKNNKVLLTKQAPGQWVLNNTYKANSKSVDILLKTMIKLEVKAPVAKAAQNNVISRISAIGTKIEVYQVVPRINIFNKIRLFYREKLTKTYYVGDNTQDNLGTYMLMKNSKVPFIIHIPGFMGFLFTRYSTLAKDWRDHTIFNFNINEIKSVTLEFTETPGESYTLYNNGQNNYTLKSLATGQTFEHFDTLKVIDFLASFSFINFEIIVDDIKQEKIDSIINSRPYHIISIEHANGNAYSMKTFHQAAAEGEFDIDGNPVIYNRDRMYALVNNGQDFVTVQFYVFDKILRTLKYFTTKEDALRMPVLEAVE